MVYKLWSVWLVKNTASYTILHRSHPERTLVKRFHIPSEHGTAALFVTEAHSPVRKKSKS